MEPDTSSVDDSDASGVKDRRNSTVQILNLWDHLKVDDDEQDHLTNTNSKHSIQLHDLSVTPKNANFVKEAGRGRNLCVQISDESAACEITHDEYTLDAELEAELTAQDSSFNLESSTEDHDQAINAVQDAHEICNFKIYAKNVQSIQTE